MKTNLLFGAALIASLAVSAPSTNAKSAMERLSNKFWAVSFYSFNRLKNKLKK